MSSSEIAFLALGLVIGGALGAAFLAAARSRPGPRREVRITIAPNSIGARRAVTLADPLAARDRRPFPGSPDDAAWPDRPDPSPATAAVAPVPAPVISAPVPAIPAPMRTRVPLGPVEVTANAVAVPVGAGVGTAAVARSASVAVADRPAPATSASRVAAPTLGPAARPGAVPPNGRMAPAARILPAVFDIGPSPEGQVRLRPTVDHAQRILTSAAVGISVSRNGGRDGAASDRPAAGASGPAAGASGPVRDTMDAPAPAAEPAAHATDPCAALRVVADERCAAAATLRERSRDAADAARAAQREFDALRGRIDRSRELADPRAMTATKAALQDRFRAEAAAATTPEEAEVSARRWLAGINQANSDAAAARRLVEAGTVELHERLGSVERLALEADVARITAEQADEACQRAREGLSRCEEDLVAVRRPPGEAPGGTSADAVAGQSAILLVMRGDRGARDRIVAAVAGSDPAAVADWQVRLDTLADAITDRAIDAGYIDLPDDDPFWGLFSSPERREIVRALSSLGFRYDGLGGFTDGRLPAARDLILAVGYAGLDRMRIRAWPHEAEIAGLYARASVAAEEWLLSVAEDLGLGPMTDALGGRAAGLGPVWDAWGRVRPALLASD